MAKRVADKELNHDNWNDEEEAEEAGSFQKASAETLQTRVFKQAKRKLAGNQEGKPNVFAGFSGFGTSTTLKAPSFSFLNPTAGSEEMKKTENNGANSTLFSFTTKPAEKKENGSTGDVVAHDDKEKEYLANLKLLNQQLTSWINEHVKKNPCCVLTPIFEDYEKHLKGLEDQKKQKKVPETPPVTVFGKVAEPSKPEAITPETKVAEKIAEETESPSIKFEFGKAAAPALNLFGGGSTTAASTATPSLSFNQKPAAAPFSFGSTTSTGAAALFSFGSAPSSDAVAPFSFGFSSTKPVVPEKKEEAEGKDEDEDEEPPKVEVKKVQEDDAFYSIRCKLFYKKDNNYTEKGVGTLFLKKVGDDKTQLIIRADTSLGNILLNIFLSPQMTMQRMGKNNVMFVCVPNPPIDPKTPAGPTPMLLRVKTETEADELFQKLKK